MCLPLVTGSSVALAIPNANSNKVRAAVLIIFRRIKLLRVCAYTVQTFSNVRILLNQSDSSEYVKAEMTKMKFYEM